MKTNNKNNTATTTVTTVDNNKEIKNLYRLLTKKELEVIDSMNAIAYIEAKRSTNKAVCQSILNDGVKQKVLTGRTWFVAEIPTNLIVVDVYQRQLRDSKVRRLAKDFDWDYVTVKTVNYRPDEGVFALIDGHHTAEVLKLKDQKTICCRVFIDYTYQQEAKLFATQDANMTKVNITEKFFADLEAQDEECCGIMDLLNKYGLKYAKIGGRKTVSSIRKMKKTVRKYGFEGLDFTFRLLFDAGWAEDDAKCFNEQGFNIGYYAYEHIWEKGGNPDKTYKELVKKLRTFKTSTAFIDYARFETGEISTRHPDKAIKDVMPCVMSDTEAKLRKKAEKIVKIIEG